MTAHDKDQHKQVPSQSYSQAEPLNDQGALLFEPLYEVGLELAAIGELAELQQAYEIVCRRLSGVYRDSRIAIYLFQFEEEISGKLALAQSSNDQGCPPIRPRADTQGVSDHALLQYRQIAVFSSAHELPASITDLWTIDPDINSAVIVPVSFGEHHYGNLEISHVKTHYFKEPDVRLIEGIALQLAITIHRLETTQAGQAAEQRAREAEVMSSIGQSALVLTHRLGNELGLIRAYANAIRSELEEQGVTNPSVYQSLDDILRDVGGVLQLSRRFRENLAANIRGQEAEEHRPAVIETRLVINEAVRAFRRFPESIKVDFEIGDDVAPLRAVPYQIVEVLHSLVQNAIEAMPDGGTLRLKASNAERFVHIEVSDTGMGIPLEQQPRIFALFYSTKGSFGFGLWSARRYVLANGGDISFRSEPGSGTTFSIKLPRGDRP